jgi:hypothetical protein
VSLSGAGITDEFMCFKRDVYHASNEPRLTEVVRSKLLGDSSTDIEHRLELLHDNLLPLIPSRPRFTKPDTYDGAQPTSISNGRTRFP